MAKFQPKANYNGIIASRFNTQKVSKRLKMKAVEVQNKIIYNLSYIGEEAVKIAREKGSYHDITGNLRSSIGYVILVDGNPVVNGKAQRFSGSEGNGSKGAKQGKEMLSKLQAKFPWGIVLIVCAGMNYAAYVEDIRHRDVLATAKLEAEKLANELLKYFT